MDPANPSTLYLGTYRLYKTTDRGQSWDYTGLSLQTPTDCQSGECISAIAVAPSDDNYVYVGTNAGNFYASSDGSATFNLVGQGFGPIAKIAVDPQKPQAVYITMVTFSGPRIEASDDAGASWNDISSNLPNIPITALVVNSGSIYVGTEGSGVFVSTNGGTNWSQVGIGLPNVDVRDLVFTANNTLVAGTYGRGVWAFVPGNQGNQGIQLSPPQSKPTHNTQQSMSVTAPMYGMFERKNEIPSIRDRDFRET
jgi:photosystem II stability/assembly factor-like uncharacterized protein